MTQSQIKPADALRVYQTRFLPAVTYSACIATFREAQQKSIFSPAVSALLWKLHCPMTMSQNVVFGSNLLGGIGIYAAECEFGLHKIRMLLGNTLDASDLSNLIQVNLGYFRLIAGTTDCPLKIANVEMPHLQGEWFCSLRTFLDAIDASMMIQNSTKLKPARERDVNLMDHVLHHCSPEEICGFNRCRLYTRAVWLSDISNGHGSTLCPQYLKTPAERIPHNLAWPRQGNPSPRDWKIWQEVLRREFSSIGNKLREEMGHWYDGLESHPHRKWDHWMDCRNYDLYSRDGDHWLRLRPQSEFCATSTIYDLSQGDRQTSLPPHKVPVTQAFSHGTRIWVSALTNENRQTQTPPQTFQEFFNTRNPKDIIRWTRYATFQMLPDSSKSWDNPTYQIFIASSANKYGAAFHWTIGYNGELAMQGQGSERNAFHYRGALLAMAAAMTILAEIREYHRLDSRAIVQVFSQCPAVIARLQAEQTFSAHSYPTFRIRNEWDVAHLIRSKFNATRLSISLHLVSKPEEGESLSAEWEQLAILQRRSEERLHQRNLEKKHKLTGPGNLMLQESPVTRTLTKTVRQAYATKLIRNHILRREDWSDQEWDLIDWEAYAQARKLIPPNQQRQLTKWSFGWLPTGRQLHRRNNDKTSHCPSCKAHQETGEHILRCRDPERVKIWLAWKASFKSSLESWYTCPELALLIRRGLAVFYNGNNNDMSTADF